jgi:hypothetical protein
MVTCLAYATSAKLLFSGSIDGSIGVWTDKGNLLQVSVPAPQPADDQHLMPQVADQPAGHIPTDMIRVARCASMEQQLQALAVE